MSIDTLRIKETVSMLEVAMRFTHLKKTGHEYKGPCPLCGGTDRFSVFKDDKGWMCRKCRPQGGDAIELIKLATNCDFAQAATFLGFVTESLARPEPVKKVAAGADWTDEQWQRRTRQKLAEWQELLKATPDALGYLAKRCIDRDLALRYHLGFEAEHCAIVIPWIGRMGQVTAVKFRYIFPIKGRRFMQMRGSRQLVFGAQYFDAARPTVIVEGEFNALSIASVAGEQLNVLSAGGEANIGPLVELVRTCDNPLLWLDDPDKAVRIASVAGTKVRLQRSPVVDGQALDANDIHQRYGTDVLRELVLSSVEPATEKPVQIV